MIHLTNPGKYWPLAYNPAWDTVPNSQMLFRYPWRYEAIAERQRKLQSEIFLSANLIAEALNMFGGYTSRLSPFQLTESTKSRSDRQATQCNSLGERLLKNCPTTQFFMRMLSEISFWRELQNYSDVQKERTPGGKKNRSRSYEIQEPQKLGKLGIAWKLDRAVNGQPIKESPKWEAQNGRPKMGRPKQRL